ncbi:MAG: hypothetical protein EOM44_13865 [Bacteroidia bacterium]|nr:hypothetical protein [Bacteroidia bacterium]
MINKIIDKRMFSEMGEYGISFASRNSGGNDYEHAFIVWYYTDKKHLSTVRRAVGFYPSVGDFYELLVEGVPGKVIDDSKEEIDKQLIVLVNKNIFDSALMVEASYSDGTYRLLSNDCVSFVRKVALAINRITVPNRITNIYPSSFISELFDSN